MMSSLGLEKHPATGDNNVEERRRRIDNRLNPGISRTCGGPLPTAKPTMLVRLGLRSNRDEAKCRRSGECTPAPSALQECPVGLDQGEDECRNIKKAGP